jgi:hypothetical protein
VLRRHTPAADVCAAEAAVFGEVGGGGGPLGHGERDVFAQGLEGFVAEGLFVGAGMEVQRVGDVVVLDRIAAATSTSCDQVSEPTTMRLLGSMARMAAITVSAWGLPFLARVAVLSGS